MFLFLTTAAALAQTAPTRLDLHADVERPELGHIEFDTESQPLGVVNGDLTSDYAQVGVIAAVFSDGSASPFCSGSLVTEDIVLTAAHCIEGADDFVNEPELSGFVFAMGANLFSGLSDYRWITAAEIHPDYNPRTIEWDLGLVGLEAPVTSMDPLCVNDEEIDSDWYGLGVDYVGWGMTSMESPMDGHKRTVSIPMYDHNRTHFFTYVEDRNICHGDSGGGAIIELADGTRMLTGVNSYGLDVEDGGYYGCDVDGAGAAAARVDTALDWIQAYTGDITCDSNAPLACPEGTRWDGAECADEAPTSSFPGVDAGAGDAESEEDDRPELACSSTGSRGLGGAAALSLLSLFGLARRRQPGR